MQGNVRQPLFRSLITVLALAGAVGLVQGARLAFSRIQSRWELAGLERERAAAERDKGALRVLCVGTSHTASYPWIPGYGFPDQLEALLRERHPDRAVAVKNAGRHGISSQTVLKVLRDELAKSPPDWVVVMLGELEDWRTDPAIDAPPPFGGFPDAPPGESHLFRTVRLDDISTLAMKWAGHLSKALGWETLKKNPRLVDEARAALTAWRPDASGESIRTVYGVKALFLARYGEPAEAEAAIDSLLRAAGDDYDLFAELALQSLRAKNGPSARFKALARRLEGRPHDQRALDLARAAFEGVNVLKGPVPPGGHRLTRVRALAIAPSQMMLYKMYTEREASAATAAADEALMNRGYWENPFEPGRIVTVRENLFGLGAKGFLEHFNRRFPSVALSPEEVAPADAAALIRAQLREAVRAARAANARVILQTYPPHRGSGAERKSDDLVREVAAAEGVFLADSFREVDAQARRTSLEEWFERPGELLADDHLNQKGNGLLARQLADIIDPPSSAQPRTDR